MTSWIIEFKRRQKPMDGSVPAEIRTALEPMKLHIEAAIAPHLASLGGLTVVLAIDPETGLDIRFAGPPGVPEKAIALMDENAPPPPTPQETRPGELS